MGAVPDSPKHHSPSCLDKHALCTWAREILGGWSSGVWPGLNCWSEGLTRWWEKRVPSLEAECRTVRKLTGMGFAGAENVTICFCSAGKRGSIFMLRDGWRVGVYMHVCACRRRRERGGQGTKGKRRSSARKVWEQWCEYGSFKCWHFHSFWCVAFFFRS